MKNNLLDYVRNELKISKKELFKIPYWDRVRMSQLAVQPVDCHLSYKSLWKKPLDADHYLLHRLAIGTTREYVRYEEVVVTIYQYVFKGRKGKTRGYITTKEVWFY